jgi:hypothetical protein
MGPPLLEPGDQGGARLEQKGKLCDPECEFFECGQRKLFKKQGSGNPSPFICGWVGDPCEGPNCAYASCGKGRLKRDMTCGLLEATVPKSAPPPSRVWVPEVESRVNLLAIVRPKVLKRMKGHQN